MCVLHFISFLAIRKSKGLKNLLYFLLFVVLLQVKSEDSTYPGPRLDIRDSKETDV